MVDSTIPCPFAVSVVAFGAETDRHCRTALIDLHDITDRKHAEEALRELTKGLEHRVAAQTGKIRLLAEAVSHLAEGIVITDDELDWPGPCIRFVNEAMCKITGYTPDELVFQTPRILQGEQVNREAMELMKIELAAGRPFLCETVNYRKDRGMRLTCTILRGGELMLTKGKTLARILIVDDHPMVREGLAMRISTQRGWEVCGEAAAPDKAIAMVNETKPDLMLVDISLKGGNGIELIKDVKARHPDVKMLVISGFQESLYAERALRAGALGYLNKQESNEKVIEAISTVLKGERYVSEVVTRRLVAQALEGRGENKNAIERLTDRELEIFRMIGEGLTSGAIADRLFLSTHTIDTHRENLKRKLGATNAAELNRQAVQWTLENG